MNNIEKEIISIIGVSERPPTLSDLASLSIITKHESRIASACRGLVDKREIAVTTRAEYGQLRYKLID